MSLPIPFSSNELAPQVRFETFEDLTTARRAVGEVRGLEDPVTSELMEDTQHAFGRGYSEFQPKTYTGDEAKIIVRALKTVAKSREDELAVSAADALSRVPLQLRAATFMTGLFKQSEFVASDAPKPVDIQSLFDPNHPEPRPPIVWESRFDNSRKSRRSKLA